LEALAVVLLAVVPGYLARTAWSRGKTFSPPTTDLTVVVQSIVASVVLQVILGPLTIALLWSVRDNVADYPWRVVLWAMTAVIVVPLFGGYLWGRVIEWTQVPARGLGWLPQRLRKDLAPMAPTIWDDVHGESILPDPSLLVLELADGRVVAGQWAKGAKAMTSPQQHGRYLTAQWAVDELGMPTEPMQPDTGLMITDVTQARLIRVVKPPHPA
jgi:hypothetical protein